MLYQLYFKSGLIMWAAFEIYNGLCRKSLAY
jgi:hypothetical protein